MSFWAQDFEGLLYTPPLEFPDFAETEKTRLAATVAVECTTKKSSKGKRICEHGVKAYICKEKGCYYKSKLCEHNTLKPRCIICSPHLKCKHEAIKSICLICTPKSCAHKKAKHHCAKCSKHLRCDHGTIRSRCRLCNVFCIHSKKEINCNICRPELTNVANNLKIFLRNPRNFYQK